MLSPDTGRHLLALARQAIAQALDAPVPPHHDTTQDPALASPGACFVTLTQQGQLRGCIGSLQAWRPLHDDLQANAVAAALRDPRFPPLRPEELPKTQIEVSVLTSPAPLHFSSEADALAQLRPGLDGVIFECGPHRSTFLPQVWEQLPDRTSFMARLKQKAGLSADFWSPDVKLQRYGVQHWEEQP